MLIHRIAPLVIVAALCSSAGLGAASGASDSAIDWTGLRHVNKVVDLTEPNSKGAILVSAGGRLDVLTRAGAIQPFAPNYSAPSGLENYMALSSGLRVGASDCRWPAGNLYTLRLSHDRGITVVTPQGRVSKFVSLHPNGLENGIAFDRTGRFGHRLLVTATSTTKRATGVTTLYAISCNGQVQMLTRTGPRVEGGMVVAPSTFGRFAGDLLAPDEYTSKVYAFMPNGQVRLVVRTGGASGGDIGTESLGIVPAQFGQALVSDRGYPPDKDNPGDNEILKVSQGALTAAGVKPGELLVVSEGGADTVVVSCRSTCRARDIGHGPHRAHIEGHVVFQPPG
jgi:hypothetical protein